MKKAEEYILDKPEPFRSILMYLQLIIERDFPDSELKYKWHLPYYYFDQLPFCFLNQTKDYVDVAFRYNERLAYYRESLVFENRKLFCSLRYKSLEEIDELLLQYVLKAVYEYEILPKKQKRISDD